MAPRFREGTVITTKPIVGRSALVMDLEIVVRLRSGHSLLRQINAVTEASIELVDCWRADRVQVEWSDIERIDRVAYCEDNPDDQTPEIGTVDAHVPGWVRHTQIGRPFIGPDRSRDPWSEGEAGRATEARDPLAA